MKKIIWFDTETTGVNPVKNDIVQIAGIVEIDGKEVHEFELKCQPFCFDNIEDAALKVTGFTKEEMKSWQNPRDMYRQLIQIFGRYINKYDPTDKFIPAGYNAKFDIDMLNQFFKKMGDNYFGSWMTWLPLDPMYLAIAAYYSDKMDKPENFKLETLCKIFEIEIDAHDALSDIRATKKLGEYLLKHISEI